MLQRGVPFHGLDREFRGFRDEFVTLFASVAAHGGMLEGPEVAEFEQSVARQCRRRHAVAVGSCTDGLFFALQAAGLGPGDDVLVTDFSFVASASAIVRTGARPRFVDVDARGNLDLTDARQRLTARTRAMVWVHLYGQMGDPQAIADFCDEHGLILIEDAAQAFGATYRGVPAGSLGLVSCLSFDPTKVIAAPGSGGMVLTDDDQIGEQLRSLRCHGKQPGGEFAHLGYNSRMPSLTAAILSFKLQQAAAYLARRRRIAGHYHRHLPEQLLLPPEMPDSLHVYHKYVIRHACRDALAAHLKSCGIACAVHYMRPLHAEPMMRPFVDAHSVWPRVEQMSREVLSLPIHPFLTDDEVECVVRAVRQFVPLRQSRAA